MKERIFAACLLLCLVGAALADKTTTTSALVQVAPLRHMTLARRVVGYGTVATEAGATENLNFPKAGRVERLDVVPGQRVRRGETLLEIGTDPATTLAYGQAENAVDFARGELARTQSLFAQQLATRSQVDAAVKALKDAEQALAAQRALGSASKADRLSAPFDGLVVSVSAARGDRFPAGTNLLQIARTAILRARLGVEPDDSRSLRVGMKVRLASVFDPHRTADGQVTQVSGQIDPQTQLVDVSVAFSGGGFLPGTRVRGAIAADARRVLAVPRQAVLKEDDQSYLFQVVAGHAKRVNVGAGIEEGGWLEVSGKGLRDAPVVVLGNYELEDGMAVRQK